MAKKKTLGFLGLGLVGFSLYLFRRHVIGRFLRMTPPKYGVSVRRKIYIPMPDGVNLVADHYTPKGKRLFPTILVRTPYGRGGPVGPTGLLHDFLAQRFAERGYNVIVQDVRGTFDAGKPFTPFAYEAEDGKTTLKWIQEQTWFNGVLGMWGPSYLGYVQWALAGDGPLYLKAIVPVITGSNLPVTGFRDGAPTIDTVLRWIVQLEATDRKGYLANWFGLRRLLPRNLERDIDRATMHLPLKDIDEEIVGTQVPFLREWVQHLDPKDPYWKQFDHSEELPKVTASVYLVSGWYDIALRELLEDYAALKKIRGGSPYLTIGPWHHLDPEGITESMRQGITWFDVHLKGERRDLREKPVRIYLMGSGEWLEMEYWPPPANQVSYYLTSEFIDADGISRSLVKQVPVEDAGSDTYIYDPEDPTPSLGGSMMSSLAGSVDNRDLEARPDVISFTSDQLEGDIDVIGSVRLRLFIKSSLEHTDFFARLCDVHPNGRSMNVCDGLIRIEPGVGTLQVDGTLSIEIDMWSTANRFKAGHSLRLQVSSGAHPRWMRNLGTSESLLTATKSVPAHQTIYHDPDHPSALILPVFGN